MERTLIFSEKEELGREDRRDGIGEEPSVEFVSRKAAHRTSGELVGLTEERMNTKQVGHMVNVFGDSEKAVFSLILSWSQILLGNVFSPLINQ